MAGGRELNTDRPQQLLDDLETADVVLEDLLEFAVDGGGAEDALDYRGRYGSYGGALVGMKPPSSPGRYATNESCAP